MEIPLYRNAGVKHTAPAENVEKHEKRACIEAAGREPVYQLLLQFTEKTAYGDRNS